MKKFMILAGMVFALVIKEAISRDIGSVCNIDGKASTFTNTDHI